MGAGKGAVWFSNAVALVAIAVVACHAQPSATFKCSSANKPTCRPLISYSNPNTTTLGDIQKLFNVKHIMDIVGANNATKKIYGGPQRGCEGSFPVQVQQQHGTLGPCSAVQDQEGGHAVLHRDDDVRGSDEVAADPGGQ